MRCAARARAEPHPGRGRSHWQAPRGPRSSLAPARQKADRASAKTCRACQQRSKPRRPTTHSFLRVANVDRQLAPGWGRCAKASPKSRSSAGKTDSRSPRTRRWLQRHLRRRRPPPRRAGWAPEWTDRGRRVEQPRFRVRKRRAERRPSGLSSLVAFAYLRLLDHLGDDRHSHNRLGERAQSRLRPRDHGQLCGSPRFSRALQSPRSMLYRYRPSERRTAAPTVER